LTWNTFAGGDANDFIFVETCDETNIPGAGGFAEIGAGTIVTIATAAPTWELFDTFDSGSFDAQRWIESGNQGASAAVESSAVHFASTGDTEGIIQIAQAPANNDIVGIRADLTLQGNSGLGGTDIIADIGTDFGVAVGFFTNGANTVTMYFELFNKTTDQTVSKDNFGGTTLGINAVYNIGIVIRPGGIDHFIDGNRVFTLAANDSRLGGATLQPGLFEITGFAGAVGQSINAFVDVVDVVRAPPLNR
jgi:hypothetical protein